jgi:hypothetical protein
MVPLGCWSALREVFSATRQPRGQVQQPADVLSKLPFLRVPTRWALWSRWIRPTRWALLVLFQRPMTTVLRKPWGDEEEMLARWAEERRGGGTFPGPLGRAGGMAGPLGRPRWGAVCGGDPGGRFWPASVVFTRAFWHPCRVLAMCVGRGPGVVAALDPRLPSGTPIGVGRAGIERSRRDRAVVPGSHGRRARQWL